MSRRRSLSESDLGHLVWKGFPPGFTVDELYLYRKKRAPGEARPQDNLRLEEGSLKPYKSEYKRSYRNFRIAPASSEELLSSPEPVVKAPVRKKRPSANLRLEGEFFMHPEYRDLFVEHPLERTLPLRPRHAIKPHNALFEPSFLTEQHEKYIPHGQIERTEPFFKSDHLFPEGEFLVKESELRSQFMPYEPSRRPELLKRPTTLHLEGAMSTQTETHEKYIPFGLETREKVRDKSTLQDSPLQAAPPQPPAPAVVEPPPEITPKPQTTPVPLDRNNNLGPEKPKTEEWFSKGYIPSNRVSNNPEFRNANMNFTTHCPVGMSPVELFNRDEPRRRIRVVPNTNRLEWDILGSRRPSHAELYGMPSAKPKFDYNANTPRMRYDYFEEPQGEARNYSRPRSYSRGKCDETPDAENELGTRFECQPEYRKAYINYITRERPELMKPRLADVIVEPKNNEGSATGRTSEELSSAAEERLLQRRRASPQLRFPRSRQVSPLGQCRCPPGCRCRWTAGSGSRTRTVSPANRNAFTVINAAPKNHPPRLVRFRETPLVARSWYDTSATDS